MKNFILISIISLLFLGCAEEKTINGVTYQPYGFFDQNEHKSPNVVYEVNTANVVWSIILFPTVIVPVVVIGWDLWEPVRPFDPNYVPH
jgi:hypothetical protein